MPHPEANIHAHLILYPAERRLSLGITAEATGGCSFSRSITYDTDMLYDRTQEHLNNALRAITNQLTHLLKEYNNR